MDEHQIANMPQPSFPVIFSGTGAIPPASAVNYIPWAIVGFIFQYVVRRRHFAWWTKYNFVLSAALDSGVAVSAVLTFFILQYPKNGAIGLNTIQVWWGNTYVTYLPRLISVLIWCGSVFANTADALGTPMIHLAPGQTFG